MKKSTDLLIEQLASDLKPGRQWQPVMRAAVWGGGFYLLSTLGMLAYQAFRPTFLEQLLAHPRFSMEIVSIFVFSFLLVFHLFIAMVPGRKTQPWLFWLTGASLLTWVATQYFAFGSNSPQSSIVGARAHCVEEAAFYGILGMVFIFYFVAKAQIPFKIWQYFLMGLVSGIVPGALMQLACMYSPKHGMILHYGPALVVGVLATLSMPLLKRLQ